MKTPHQITKGFALDGSTCPSCCSVLPDTPLLRCFDTWHSHEIEKLLRDEIHRLHKRIRSLEEAANARAYA